MDTPVYYDFREMAYIEELSEVICDDYGNQIAACLSAEHAEHIVRAVNSHDALVEMVEMCLEWIDAVPSETELPAMPGFDRDELNDALAAAKGEPNV